MRPMAGWLALTWCAGGSAALAQPQYTWRAVDLHPPEAYLSEAYGVSLTGISGNPQFPGEPQISGATLWGAAYGSALETLLNAGDTPYQPVVWGADSLTQCGYDADDWAHAALWFGTCDSMVDLHPGPPYLTSEVMDVRGGMAAGNAGVGGKRQAIAWLAQQPVEFADLHPDGASNSYAYATDGDRQGGSAYMLDFGGAQAVVWDDTPQSMVVMHPPGYGYSIIHAMAPGAQAGVGLVRIADGRLKDHALLWHDTPESWLDMHPSFHPGANSYMFGTTGDMHVGRSNGRAGIWFGDDPESFLDLHQFVPGDPGGSNADDIDVYDGRVYIAGRATFVRPHAMMWIGTPVDGLDGGDGPGPSAPRRTPTPRP